MTQRPRSIVFGDDPHTYEAYRPGYPPAAIDHLLALSGPSRAIEIGAGTGKATQDLARHGLSITCLEPSPEMAAILSGKVLPGVDVVVTTFEDWAGPDDRFDLVYAAQAWHWVERPSGYEKVKRLLRPGGALALMWNIPTERYAGFDDVYRRHAPHLLDETDERIKSRDEPPWLGELEQAGFAEVSLFTHDWSVDLDPETYRSLNSTYSDHMLLPEPVRTDLLTSLEQAVHERGGSVTLDYQTQVFSGKAPA